MNASSIKAEDSRVNQQPVGTLVDGQRFTTMQRDLSEPFARLRIRQSGKKLHDLGFHQAVLSAARNDDRMPANVAEFDSEAVDPLNTLGGEDLAGGSDRVESAMGNKGQSVGVGTGET